MQPGRTQVLGILGKRTAGITPQTVTVSHRSPAISWVTGSTESLPVMNRLSSDFDQ